MFSISHFVKIILLILLLFFLVQTIDSSINQRIDLVSKEFKQAINNSNI